ncbi:cysteine proteinase [Mollisia scopiformis]|uniref:ubiquitinyl hydrolase 1 n=1 Tax=Mollisia scopiformis TaxID=149040 RepID=A0A194XPT0_MOLSC|nr:cysteine proteinase [Mollisia scopiformis]KUJ21752.1 cysteine proteinase [Mollisia scopiformis]
MNPHGQQVRASFHGDPNTFEYHQDYLEGRQSLAGGGTFFAVLVCLIPFVYQIFSTLGYDLLPIPELLWNVLVYVTPSRLLDAVENYTNPLRIQNPALRGIPRTHASKSESMRQLLGLDTAGGLIGSVAQASRRRLSTLPGVNITNLDAEGKPAGLGNWDNSCYQNSVLQGLASLDTITEYLTNPSMEVETMEESLKPELRMAEALKGLIETLNDSENNGKRIWTPATLKNMSSWQQQDAQEYFSKVLDEIDKEIGKVAKLAMSSQGFESDDSSNSSPPAPSTTFRNPLEGLIAQRVGCTKCGYSEGLSMIPFNCLTVPLGKAWEYDITDCLDEYTKLEQIDGVECGKCTLLKYQRMISTILERSTMPPDSPAYQQAKARLEAVELALEDDDYEDKTLVQKCKIPSKNRESSTKSRQAVIARPPKSMVVHFNRSLFDELTGELRKNTAMVRFPKILDIAPWSLGSAEDGEDVSTEEWKLNPDQPMIASTGRPSRLRGPLYELRAVVTHYGRHENGHYVCYRKHTTTEIVEDLTPETEDQKSPEQWWRLSDEDVMKVTEESVLNQGGVFMLFYDCIAPATPIPSVPITQIPEHVAMSEKIVNTLPVKADEVVKSTELPDLDVVASIPLPDIDDEDLFSNDSQDQDSVLTTRDESIATTETDISEYDEDENLDKDQVEAEDYQPAKAILVPPYIRQPGINDENEDPTKQKMLGPASSLVMV